MFRNTTPVVKNLILINALFFLVQEFSPGTFGEQFTNLLGLHTIWSKQFQVYQFVTSIFLHGSITHLFFNMFALWMFGQILERDLTSKRFLIYYLVTGVGAGLLHSGILAWELYDIKQTADSLGHLFTDTDWNNYNRYMSTITLGASGAVFGILLGFGSLHPNERIMLLIPPIPIRAKYFVIIYGAIELLWGVSGSTSNIAHFAHVGGMLFGYLLLWYWTGNYRIWKN